MTTHTRYNNNNDDEQRRELGLAQDVADRDNYDAMLHSDTRWAFLGGLCLCPCVCVCVWVHTIG